MTWPGIEPRSSRPLVNTLPTRPMSLIHKDPKNEPSSVTCLPMMLKIQTERGNLLPVCVLRTVSERKQEEQTTYYTYIDQGRKCTHGMDWMQGLWYGPENLENRVSKNIRQWHKLNLKIHGKLENGISNWITNLRRGENPKRHLGRLLSSQLFFIAMVPLKYLLWKCTRGNKFTKS